MSIAKGAVELIFTYEIADTCDLIVSTNITGMNPFPTYTAVRNPLSFRVHKEVVTDEVFFVITRYCGTEILEISDFGPFENISAIVLRAYIYDEFASFYINEKWIYSGGVANVDYPDPIEVDIVADGATMFFDRVERFEIPDHREAIYVDLETSAENALGSVIQQRPIEMFTDTGRTLSFTYALLRDEIYAHHIERANETREDPPQMSSDGLVYYADVGITMDTKTAEDVGLITRMYRLSELETGAIRGAKMLQDKSRQRRNMMDISARLDPRLEVGDIYHIDVIVTSTNRHIIKDVIIENITLSATEKRYSMNLTGRVKDD